jgi:hypothetical protein
MDPQWERIVLDRKQWTIANREWTPMDANRKQTKKPILEIAGVSDASQGGSGRSCFGFCILPISRPFVVKSFMPDLQDGESVEMQGSGAKPYVLKNTGGVYSCSCPGWRNQSVAIEKRSCKHLRKLRGDAAEEARVARALPQRPVRVKTESDREGDEDSAALVLPANQRPRLSPTKSRGRCGRCSH